MGAEGLLTTVYGVGVGGLTVRSLAFNSLHCMGMGGLTDHSTLGGSGRTY